MAVNEASRASLISLTGSEPAAYRAHALHLSGRAYPETNCYTDVIIELLHARGLEPLAMLGHVIRVDFEGDQFTFFKPPPGDLESLFGVDIHEMQPYRELPLQIAQQLASQRTIIVELDAWFLPDTAATSYRREHVKTSVAIEAIDPAAEVLRYFHNRGLFELSGSDYRSVLWLDAAPVLPPYAELVRFDAAAEGGDDLRAIARRLLEHHLARVPRQNPFERYGQSLEHALPELLGGELDTYHAYAFATVRMAGAAFELAAAHLEWLFGPAAHPATGAHLMDIVETCKALSFRMARRRAFDPLDATERMAASWSRALSGIAGLLG